MSKRFEKADCEFCHLLKNTVASITQWKGKNTYHQQNLQKNQYYLAQVQLAENPKIDIWASIIQNLLSFGHFSVECKQILYVAGIRYASKHHTESTEFSPKVSEFCMLLVLWFDQALYRNYLHLANVAKNCQKMHVSKFCMLLVHTIKQVSYRNRLVFKIFWLLLALSDIQKDTESNDI